MTNVRISARFLKYAVRAVAITIVPAFLLVQSSLAQGGRGLAKGNDVNKTYPLSDHDTSPYDKHDFNGIWVRNPSELFHQPPCPECRDNTRPSYGFFGDVPPMTAEGQKRFEANHPTKGFVPGTPQALANADIPIGYRRAVQSALSNDPEERCEPLGLIRLVTFSGGNPPMQVVQTPEIIIERFEWFWDNREIWTDGRKLPNVDDYLPRFNGYSVGKWEGDTLVVTTVGFDDRAWVDAYGYPISEKAVLEERYSRPTHNRLRLDMTLTDPLTYTRPWHASTKVWALIPKKDAEVGGWAGIVEDRCVPQDNAHFRSFEPEPAGKPEPGSAKK
jgi:hypothetical protein